MFIYICIQTFEVCTELERHWCKATICAIMTEHTSMPERNGVFSSA